MARIEPLPSGKWKFHVCVNYRRKSKTFRVKAQGQAWANEMERELAKAGSTKAPVDATFGDLMEAYLERVTPGKRGHRSESLRINRLLKDKLSKVRLAALGKSDFSDWRDRRLKEVSALSVLREWATMSHAITTAIDDWEWLTEHPMKSVAKPSAPPPRERLPTAKELEDLSHVFSWDGKTVPVTATARVGAAMWFAIETGMRAKEICNLRVTDLVGRTARIGSAKTLAGVREVPLSAAASEILKLLARVDLPGDSVFHLSTSQLDALWRKGRGKAMVEDLHFHDLRAEACTRLAKRLNPLELARMLGHSDLSKLMIYYRETAESLAGKL
jgi:integrase